MTIPTRILLTLALAAAPGAAFAARPAVKALSLEEALARGKRVSNARYELFFDLGAAEPTFQGAATLRFDLKGAGEPLTVDFQDGRIVALEANGTKAAPDYNGLFLTLPAALLREGANSVRIDFVHPYSATGAGLYRFKDPADGRVYVYTDFEPYDANLLFPCFDQPDIKGRYTLSVKAPLDWQVISSARETEIRPAGGRRLWVFPESAPFSTYIFSLHAGPYVEWSSSFEKIPLRLFARHSMAEFVPVEDWLKFTKQGLGFFNRYFDYPYPFVKYDQVIVPDFNSGAMENVAAVTFSERYISRGKPTWRDRENLAGVILHEMAHMWFGDLVTMKWWDDLWLNESFASYMADLALHEATEFKDAWQVFFLDTKQWAYWEDQLVTTHPIEAQVPDTEQAFSNFDGITYGKGGSALKQISYYIGADKFRDGTRRYFKRHAFGNARRKDFMDALESASKKDLSAWTAEWLQTAGLNSVTASYACRDGKIKSFALIQSAPDEHPQLRRHRAEIGLFGTDAGGKLAALERRPGVDYAGRATQLPALAGRPCPELVLPNLGDHDYAKILLDPRSLATIKKRLSDVSDDLDRAMFWMSLWNMVQNAELSAVEYAELALAHLPREGNFQILTKAVETLYGRRLNSNSVLRYLAADEGPAAQQYARLVGRFEEFFWSQLEKAEPGSDPQKLWLDAFLRVARSPESSAKIALLLGGKLELPGLPLDQDRRWNAVASLNRHAAPGSRERISAELKRDNSRRGQTEAIRAEVLRPDWETKKPWLDKIKAPDSGLSLAEQRTAMQSLFPYEQARLHRRFAEEYFSWLKALAPVRPNEFLESFAEQLVPATCRAEDSAALGAFLDANPGLSPVISKELKVARQENGRCIRARALIGPRAG